jgi:hypothetical protein
MGKALPAPGNWRVVVSDDGRQFPGEGWFIAYLGPFEAEDGSMKHAWVENYVKSCDDQSHRDEALRVANWMVSNMPRTVSGNGLMARVEELVIENKRLEEENKGLKAEVERLLSAIERYCGECDPMDCSACFLYRFNSRIDSGNCGEADHGEA